MKNNSEHPIENHQLQAFLDGELDPGLAGEIQSHLKSCPGCQEELNRLENLHLRLQELPDIGLTRDITRQVVSQLKADRSLSPAITWTILIEAVAAGAVIGALIPMIRAAGWLPSYLEARIAIQATLNIFLAQLASGWLVWWTGVKLQTSHLLTSIQFINSPALGGFSPWAILGIAGGLLVVLNGLLLGKRSLLDQNHHRI